MRPGPSTFIPLNDAARVARRRPTKGLLVVDASSLLLFGVLIVAVIAMMFFSNRRRKREAQTMEQKMQVGAKIMTGSGIFGTILELVPDENEVVQKVIIETAPGQTLTMHRQAISRYLDDEVPAEEAGQAAQRRADQEDHHRRHLDAPS